MSTFARNQDLRRGESDPDEHGDRSHLGAHHLAVALRAGRSNGETIFCSTILSSILFYRSPFGSFEKKKKLLFECIEIVLR